MARKPISITLDEDMIARIDRLAEDEGRTRTSVIERALRNDLPEQEKFNRTLENPLVREAHKLVTSRAMLEFISMLAGENPSEEDIRRVLENAPKLREMGRQKQVEKKAKRRKKGDES
jgi:predicted transcriptional regulator